MRIQVFLGLSRDLLDASSCEPAGTRHWVESWLYLRSYTVAVFQLKLLQGPPAGPLDLRSC